MKRNALFGILFLTLAVNCWGQDSYTLPLAKANTALSLPAMTAGGGVLYEAHRSFDLLRFSNQLQVSAFDLATHKELRHTVLNVPRVHGARAAEGFFLSPDGQALVYAEIHEPNLLLVLSAKDLSEVRRTNALPFTSADIYRLFAGFDESGLLSFASGRAGKLRFVRMNLSDFKITSEVTGPKQLNAEAIVWSPKSRTTWLQLPSGEWAEYTEAGESTGAKFGSQGRYRIDHGATVLGGLNLLAYFGNMSDVGSVVSYRDHHSAELDLTCVPRPYSSGDVADYAGAICTTSPDREPEHGGNKILTSEFLLLKADGPAVVWRHAMDFLSVADSNDPDTGVQWGDPLIYRSGKKVLIIAPTKSPELAVYEVALPNDSSVASVSN
jgi:hypothetical protein